MNEAVTPQVADETVHKWAHHIAAKVALYSRERDSAPILKNLLQMDAETIKWVYFAMGASSSTQLYNTFSVLILLGAEQSLLSHARFWETYEFHLPSSVRRAAFFQYLDEAPLTGSNEQMSPYVAKALALCAVTVAFNLESSSIDRVQEIDEKHSDYVDMFIQNRERAVELAVLMNDSKASTIAELKYHLDLHSAVATGEL